MKLSVVIILLSAAVSVCCHPALKVIGGRDAAVGEFPYIVSLQRAGMNNEQPFVNYCGGAIISPTYVLTSAECLYNKQNGYYKIVKIVAGAVNIIGGNSTYRQEVHMANFIVHPNYKPNTFGVPSAYDLAIVKLNSSLKFTDGVKAAKLPTYGAELAEGDKLDFAGWGLQQDGDDFKEENNLQIIKFPTINYTICNSTLTKLYENIVDTTKLTLDEKHSLCTGPLNNGTSIAIFGDNGGPFILNGTVYGIHSWTVNYFFPLIKGVGPSAVVVKISSFVQWIKQNVDDL